MLPLADLVMPEDSISCLDGPVEAATTPLQLLSAEEVTELPLPSLVAKFFLSTKLYTTTYFF